MAVYLVLAGYLVLAVALEFFCKARFPNSRAARFAMEAALIVGVLAMTFISAYRLNTGYDYGAYARAFMDAFFKSIDSTFANSFERGYILVNIFAGYFSINIKTLFICVAVIVSGLLYIGLKALSPSPLVGLLAFYMYGFFFNSMNFHRNFIAALIVFVAFAFLRNTPGNIKEGKEPLLQENGIKSKQYTRSFIRYMALVLVASSFHFSAALMLLFWIILNVRFSAITLAVYGVVSVILIAFATPMMEFVTTYIYTSYSPETSPHMYNGIPAIYSLCLGLLFVISFIWRKKFLDRNWGTVLISAAYFAFFFEFLGSRHSILGRFTMYFGPVVVMVLIPELIKTLVSVLKDSAPSEKSLNQAETEIDPVEQEKQNDFSPPAIESVLSSTVTSAVQKQLKIQKIAAIVSLVCIALSASTFFVYAIIHNYNGVIPHDWIWNL